MSLYLVILIGLGYPLTVSYIVGRANLIQCMCLFGLSMFQGLFIGVTCNFMFAFFFLILPFDVWGTDVVHSGVWRGVLGDSRIDQ